MENKKNEFWQIIRGMCILAVVAIHCPSGATYSVGEAPFVSWLVLRQLINFPVAIFVFMVGYFTNADKCINERGTYVRNRGGDYLYPFCYGHYFIVE